MTFWQLVRNTQRNDTTISLNSLQLLITKVLSHTKRHHGIYFVAFAIPHPFQVIYVMLVEQSVYVWMRGVCFHLLISSPFKPYWAIYCQ